MLDLTPFGFTPTESQAYACLLEGGHASGYAVAKALGVARANAYQALDGLVSKGAASMAHETPRVYRPLSPAALLALITERETAQLDALEQALTQPGRPGEPATFPFAGERRFEQLVLRTVARAAGLVVCVAPFRVLQRTVPVWRKREADSAATALWALDKDTEGFGVHVQGTVPLESALRYFGSPPTLIATEQAAIVARSSDSDLSGYWTSDPLLTALAKATVDFLVQAPAS